MTDPTIALLAARARAAAEMHMGRELDRLCRDFGMDPVEVWRRPRQAEIDYADFRARWISGIDYHAWPPAGIFIGVTP